jgi:hypothetical protein
MGPPAVGGEGVAVAVGHWSSAGPERSRRVVIGHWSLVIGHWSLVIGHWSLVIGHWSLNRNQFLFPNDK